MVDKRRVIRSFTVGLYVMGSVFLLLTARAWYQATVIPDGKRQYLVANEPFEYDALRRDGGFRSHRPATLPLPGQLVAVFLMPVDPCTDCLNEVHAYLSMLAQGGLHGISVHSDVVFVGENLEEARRFARTADFEQEVLYGAGEIFDGQLQEFGSATVTHQMLLIDPTIDRLFFRSRLAPGAGSAPEVRDDILWEARKAYDALPGNSKRQN